jgi:DNA repair ATPase RecN
MTRGKSGDVGKAAVMSDWLAILAKLSPLEPLVSEVAALKNLLKKLQEEVETLCAISSAKDKEISLLKTRLNNLEQHHRGWSIRVNNLPIEPSTANNPRKVMEALYSKALILIL